MVQSCPKWRVTNILEITCNLHSVKCFYGQNIETFSPKYMYGKLSGNKPSVKVGKTKFSLLWEWHTCCSMRSYTLSGIVHSTQSFLLCVDSFIWITMNSTLSAFHSPLRAVWMNLSCSLSRYWWTPLYQLGGISGIFVSTKFCDTDVRQSPFNSLG